MKKYIVELTSEERSELKDIIKAERILCLDEASKQLVAETHRSIAVEPGKTKRVDAEYLRCGTASVFMMNAPLEG